MLKSARLRTIEMRNRKNDKQNKLRVKREKHDIKKFNKQNKLNKLIKFKIIPEDHAEDMIIPDDQVEEVIISDDETIIDNEHHALILITERYRLEQQTKLLPRLIELLTAQQIKHHVLIIHQNNHKLFNKGCLYNIGYNHAIKKKIKFDYIILHDIDLIPVSSFNYSYSKKFCRIYGTINNFFDDGGSIQSIPSAPFVSGIYIIDKKMFVQVNGFSNIFEGWGYEDTNFNKRIKSGGFKTTCRHGVFDSCPNARLIGKNNDKNFQHLDLKNGFNTLFKSSSLKSDNPDKIPFQIIAHIHDTNVEHIYVNFPSKSPQSLHVLHDKKKYLLDKILHIKKIMVCLINGSSYFKDLINDLLTKNFKDIEIIYHDKSVFDCDILVSSFFDDQSINHVIYHCYKIFISGEPNIINKYYKYDLIIDTKINTFKDVDHLYIPFYVNSLYERRINKISDLLQPKPNYDIKTKFCAFLYNQCHSHREKFFHLLNKYKRVDALGKCCANIINHQCSDITTDRRVYTDQITYNDLAVQKYMPYKFVLAMENTDIDGYISEKILNPMFAGSIPIYFGNKMVKEQFNPKSFININDFSTFDQCIEYIKKVDNDDNLYNEMQQQPYFIENKLNTFLSEENNLIFGTFRNLLYNESHKSKQHNKKHK